MTDSTDSNDKRATELATKDAAAEAFELRQFLKVKRFGRRRKDGQAYPKDGEKPVLEFRGQTARLEKYDNIFRFFIEVARKNNLPDVYAYHLISDLSDSSLQVRFKLDRDEVNQLKTLAREHEQEGVK